MPDDGTKQCRKCGEAKSLDAFRLRPGARDGHRSECAACQDRYLAGYYTANRERVKARVTDYYHANREAKIAYAHEWRRRYYVEARDKVFAHYGQTCACCEATAKLTIDHIEGNGADHRRELFGNSRKAGEKFYVWLVREGFPDGYQTLCHLCNNSKGTGERCRLDHGHCDTVQEQSEGI